MGVAPRHRTAAICVAIALAFPSVIWADVPSGTLLAERVGDEVRLEVSWSYHGTLWMPDCEIDMGRWNLETDQRELIFSGDLGELSFECECGWWFTWEDGMIDARGEPCKPGDGVADVRGDCPEGHSCDCVRRCRPFYDKPCNGSYEYRAVEGSAGELDWIGGMRATVTVDWRAECDEASGWPAIQGCGCGIAGSWSHLLMALIFSLTGLVPLFVRSRKRRR